MNSTPENKEHSNEQLSLFEARSIRDRKINQISKNSKNFMKESLLKISLLKCGKYTGEDIRYLLTKDGLIPHHPNAWGALISHAVRKGIIKETGLFTQMLSKKSHARKTQIYDINYR